MKLYASDYFRLVEIRSTGKKETPGILCFKGKPSVFGSYREILALESGIVLKAGRNVNPRSREFRIGQFVTLGGHDGVTVTYGRLSACFVSVGDYVSKGQCIGLEGASGSGSGEFLTLEFRRNGRRIDGCDYLGIAHRPTEFRPEEHRASEIVSRACGLDHGMKEYLDSFEDAGELWRRLLLHLSGAETERSDAYEGMLSE